MSESNKIRVTIVHPNGVTRSRVKLPTNVQIKNLIPALAAHLKISLSGLGGRPTEYEVAWNGQTLNPNATLAEAGLRDDTELRLYTKMKAGPLDGLHFPDDDGDDIPLVRLTDDQHEALVMRIATEVELRFRDAGIEILEQSYVTEEERKRDIMELEGPSIFSKPSDNAQFQSDAFMIMPFRPEYDEVYTEIIEPLFADMGLTVKRGDAFRSHHGRVMDDVYSAIWNCTFVISECSIVNPNVYYELGMAHTLQKPSIIITQGTEKMPFDLRHLRYLRYSVDSPRSTREFRDSLESYILTMLKDIEEDQL